MLRSNLWLRNGAGKWAMDGGCWWKENWQAMELHTFAAANSWANFWGRERDPEQAEDQRDHYRTCATWPNFWSECLQLVPEQKSSLKKNAISSRSKHAESELETQVKSLKERKMRPESTQSAGCNWSVPRAKNMFVECHDKQCNRHA